MSREPDGDEPLGYDGREHRVSRWSAWTKPRFSYLELIGIYIVVSALVDLVWHR